jgi:predicted dehydrogenase
MQVKLCLIGAGHMGRIHAQKLARMKDVQLTCIVDSDPLQAEETGRTHGVMFSDRFDSIIGSGLHGAVVASPTETHFPIARELLENNIHVFVEKPLAANPDQARELVALARRKGLLLQVGHLERFSPPFRRALPLIDNPLSIATRRISGFTGRSTDIDVIFDLMIHDIDLVMSLKQAEVTRITARGTPVLTARIDVAHGCIEFADGSVATLTASRISGTKERSVEIVQKGRFISLDLSAGKMLCIDGRGPGKRAIRSYAAVHPDPVHDELRAFIKAIREGRGPLVSGEDGLQALIIAHIIKEQIEQRLAETECRNC